MPACAGWLRRAVLAAHCYSGIFAGSGLQRLPSAWKRPRIVRLNPDWKEEHHERDDYLVGACDFQAGIAG